MWDTFSEAQIGDRVWGVQGGIPQKDKTNGTITKIKQGNYCNLTVRFDINTIEQYTVEGFYLAGELEAEIETKPALYRFQPPTLFALYERKMPNVDLMVVIRNTAPFIFMQEPCSHRSVRIKLTEEQLNSLTLFYIGQSGKTIHFEEISQSFLSEN